MAWHASHIYAPAAPRLESEFCERFPANCHRLDPNAFADHDWHDLSLRHGVPESGVLALWPIADPEHAGWYDLPVVSWTTIDRPEMSKVHLRPFVPLFHADGDAIETPHLDVVRRFLSYHSDRHGVPIMHYYCETWGGDVEAEYACVVHGERELVINTVATHERTSTLAITENGQSVPRERGDTLVRALAEIGWRLPSPYFAPHTRGYDWSRHRVTR